MRLLSVILAAVLASNAVGQQGSEVAVNAGKAFVAFQHRAWSLNQGRVRVFSDLEPDNAQETFDRIGAILAAIDRVFDGMKPRRQAGELQVWLIEDRNEYLSALRMIAGANGANTPGMATARGAETHVFVHRLNWSTIQHELWHAANSLFVPNMPTWLNEGIATIFEKGTFIGDQFVLGSAPTGWLAHARTLRTDDTWVPLATFVQDNEGWNARVAGGSEDGEHQYVEAWAIAHFLLFSNNGAYRSRVNTMLKRLHQGQSEAAVLRAGLGRDLKAVEALDESIGAFLASAQPTDMIATHQLFDTWARGHARTFPNEGRINHRDLDTAMSLARWMIDARHGKDLRNVRDTTNIRAGRGHAPPLLTINPLDGAQWTITWTRTETGFEPVIRWSMSQ